MKALVGGEASEEADQFLSALGAGDASKAKLLSPHAARASYFNAFLYALDGDQVAGQRALRYLLGLADFYQKDVLDWTTRSPSLGTLALAYDWLSPMLGPDEAERIRVLISTACERSYQHYLKAFEKPSPVLETSPYDPLWAGRAARLGLAALAIEGEGSFSRDWLNAAITIAADHLQYGFSADGQVYAGAAHALAGMDEVGELMVGLYLRGEDFFQEPALRRVPIWLLYETSPSAFGASPPAGPVNQPGRSAFLTLLAARFGRVSELIYRRTYSRSQQDGPLPDPVATILWAVPARKPDFNLTRLALDQHFSAGGAVYFRSGWGQNDLSVSVRSGPVTFADRGGYQGSFSLAGEGSHLVVNLDHLLQSPLAFNTVYIDRHSQAAGEGAGNESVVTDFLSSPNIGLALVNLKPAYDYRVVRDPETGKLERQPFNPVEAAARGFLFVRGAPAPYLAVVDSIQKDSKSRTYDWLLHLPEDRDVRKEGNVVTVSESYSGSYLVRSAEGPEGKIILSFDIPAEGVYWGWMLLRGAMPLGARKEKKPEDGKNQASPNEWRWQRVPFGGKSESAVSLLAGKHDLVLQGKEDTSFASCLLTLDKDFIPEGVEPKAPEGSVWVRAGEAGKITGPWRRIKGNPRKPVLRVVFTESNLDKLAVDRMPQHPELPVLRSAQEGVRGRFSALFLPSSTETPLPEIKSSERGNWGSAITLEWKKKDAASLMDYLAFSDQGSATAGTVQSNGFISFCRQASTEEDAIPEFALVRGTYLQFKGTRLIQGEGGLFSVLSDGPTLRIQGKGIRKLKILGPHINQVYLNSQPVSFTVDKDNYLYPRLQSTTIPSLDKGTD